MMCHQTGLCVLATTTVQFAQATIGLPNTRSDNGGLHGLEVTAEVHNPTSLVASAHLTILLCQQGTDPTCG